jgi:anti-sigma factor RsiW
MNIVQESPQSDFIDLELQAYIDGNLDPEAMAEMEARLAGEDDLRMTADALSNDMQLIRDAAEAMDTGPVSLRTAALEKALAQRLPLRRWQVVAAGPATRQIAAGIALFAMGWGGNMLMGPAANAYPDYVQEGLGAHQVFAHDSSHPVEFQPDATTVALDWMSQKLKHKINSPALDALGLELIGTRLSGTREGPLAQFIYQDKNGNRLSLVVMPHPEGMPEADLKLASLDQNRVGYWRGNTLDYAVIAETSDVQIENVASEISRSVAPLN